MATEPIDGNPVLQLPQVLRNGHGQVTITLDLTQARVLRRLLGHYAVLSAAPADQLLHRWMFQDPATPSAPALGAVKGYDPALWSQTAVALCREVARASSSPARLVAVPRGLTPAPTTSDLEQS